MLLSTIFFHISIVSDESVLRIYRLVSLAVGFIVAVQVNLPRVPLLHALGRLYATSSTPVCPLSLCVHATRNLSGISPELH